MQRTVKFRPGSRLIPFVRFASQEIFRSIQPGEAYPHFDFGISIPIARGNVKVIDALIESLMQGRGGHRFAF